MEGKGGFCMISYTMKLKLITLAAKHGIQVEHFAPGEVIISIDTWQEYEESFIELVDDLHGDPNIYSISFDASTGFVYIKYDHTALENKENINNWIKIFEQYSF